MVAHISLTSHAPGVGQCQNVGLRDFCHSLTLLPPGATVFHKHMSCSLWMIKHAAVSSSFVAVFCCQGVNNMNKVRLAQHIQDYHTSN